MRIAITADPELTVPPILYGGLERIVDLLIKGYLYRGHEIHLFANADSDTSAILHPWKGKSSFSKIDTLKNASQLYNAYRKYRFDAIHCNSRLAYLTPLLPLSLRKLMTYHREPTVSQVRIASALSKSHSLIFSGCSNYISDQITPFARSKGIYNCIDTSVYHLNTQIDPQSPLLFLGRIEPVKGAKEAVEIAIQTGNRLLIAGNIPEQHQSYFDQYIKPYLSDTIQYVGPVNDIQKDHLLQAGKALLMPIQWNEPFGIVMIEAMACGTPVIGYRRGAVPEVIEQGLTGFIADTKEEMVSYITNIHLLNRTEIRNRCEARFNHHIIADTYLEYILHG